MGALDVAERIREKVAALRVSWDAHTLRSTVSVGVAGIGASHGALDEVIAEAGNAIADELASRRGGRYPDFDEIAAELEARLAAKHARIRGQQSAPAPATAKRASPTLSSRDSSERSRAPKAISEEERMAAIARWVAESWKVG